MRERDHNNLEYEGAPGEDVTITVTRNGTTQMVQFTLDGDTMVLHDGDPIRFKYKNASGQRTDLQIAMDFNHVGSYEVVVENVSNCSRDIPHTGSCRNGIGGPPKEFLTFAFFVI
jgi:hypothetical protein